MLEKSATSRLLQRPRVRLATCLFGLSMLTMSPSASPAQPTTEAKSKAFASEGDSISVTWGGNYTGIYANRHPGLRHCGLASGGGVGEIAARMDKVMACRPDVLSILVGAHGLEEGPNTADFLRNLFAYTDAVRRHGIKVAVATVLPEYHVDNPAFDAIFSRRRVEANAAIRAAVGSHIDAVIDFAADPIMGPDSAAKDLALYRDGTHPTDGCGMGCGGQGKLASVYAPVMDKLLGFKP